MKRVWVLEQHLEERNWSGIYLLDFMKERRKLLCLSIIHFNLGFICYQYLNLECVSVVISDLTSCCLFSHQIFTENLLYTYTHIHNVYRELTMASPKDTWKRRHLTSKAMNCLVFQKSSMSGEFFFSWFSIIFLVFQ